MLSGAPEGSGIQNKRGLEAADPESWSTLCYVPEEERLRFQNVFSKVSDYI